MEPVRARVTIDARPADRIDILVSVGASADVRSAARSVPRGDP
jgi:hypothetical protein